MTLLVKLNSIQKFKKVNNSTDGKTMSQQYMPVPYNMDFELFVMLKNSDDALQIVEQILPFFQPDYTVTLNDNSAMGTTRDVPIVLTNVGYEDSYEGDMVTRRSIIYTLSFTAKFYLYGLLLTRRLLRQYRLTSTQIYLSMHLRENRDILLHQVPITADADDDFGFNETTSFFQDAKNYDETTGTDTDDA